MALITSSCGLNQVMDTVPELPRAGPVGAAGSLQQGAAGAGSGVQASLIPRDSLPGV